MSTSALSEVTAPTSTSAPREGKELIDASRPFADDSPTRSAWYTFTTTLALGGATAVAALAPWTVVRVIAALVEALLIVRMFILYHDFMHGAILRTSRLARAFFYTYGVLVLTPPRVWRETHNYHHANNAKMIGSHVGSYPTVTTDIWWKLTPKERFLYKAARHPLTILFAYVTVFLFGMCLSSFLRRPSKNWDSMLSIVVHVALTIAIGFVFGADVLFFAWLLPIFVAHLLGAYLFYAQHNFEGMHLQGRHEWTYTRAATESSSYMEMSPLMHWFTGNIGYHHVHHLNPSIPFYRLPAAMDAIPELQNPGRTSLMPSQVLACFRLKLWDNTQRKMVGYPKAPPAESSSAVTA